MATVRLLDFSPIECLHKKLHTSLPTEVALDLSIREAGQRNIIASEPLLLSAAE